jgi:hypothetical protein
MAVPIDPLKREWVQVSDVNPALVSQLRPTLVAFLAFDRDHMASLAGSGFIIAGESDIAFVLTAKHVLLEGVLRIQRPVPFHAGSALFLPKGSRIPSLAPDRLKVIWMGEQSAALMSVVHASFNESTDVACCVIGSQELHASSFVPTSIPLHTMVPSVGDMVQMVSLDKMVIDELSPPTDSAGTGQMTSITTRVSVRHGTVTGDYPNGLRQYGWPCFTTSIPAEPGMSGGFVCLPIQGQPLQLAGSFVQTPLPRTRELTTTNAANR